MSRIGKSFVKSVSILVGGAAFSQLLTFLFTPVLTRLYGPEQFGVMGSFVALTSILLTISTAGYSTAIVLPREDGEAQSLVAISAIICSFISAVLLLMVLVFGDPVWDWLGLADISDYLFLVPISTLLGGFSMIAMQWMLRARDYKSKSVSTVLGNVVTNVFKLLAGLNIPSAFMLIVSTLLPPLTTFLYAFSRVPRFGSNIKSCLRVDAESIKSVLKSYRDFPGFQAPQVLANSLTQNIPVLIFGYFFDATAVGLYSLARVILQIPSTLLGTAVGNVFYAEMSALHSEGKEFYNVLLKSTFYLLLLSILPYSVFFLAGPYLFEILLGSEWRMSGEYAAIMAPWLLMVFLNQPSVQTFIILRKQKLSLAINLISMSLRIGIFYLVCEQSGEPEISMIILSALGVVHNVIFIGMAHVIARNKKLV